MDNTGISFAKATSNMQHTEKTVTPSGFTSTISFFDKLINGDKATGLRMPDSDNPKTFSKEYSTNEKISYSLQGSSTLTAMQAADHTVKMQPFVAKEGAMTFGTAVELNKTDTAYLWRTGSVYQTKPDPSLLLPFKFVKDGSVFRANTNEKSAMQIRGIRFYVPDFAFYSDNRLVNGLKYEIRVPLYNASFKDTGNFNVRLSWATDNSPTATKTPIGTVTMSLEGWSNDGDKNKGTAKFEWTPNLTSNKKASNKKYYFYVEIDPDTALDEVHEARYNTDNATINDYGGNNTGFYPFYVYDYDDAESSGGKVLASLAADEITLNPLTFRNGDGKEITDIAGYVNTNSDDSFLTMTAEFTYKGTETPYAYLVGYILTPSGKAKIPTAGINTIVNLNDLESDDVSEVFMVNDIALFNGTNTFTFTFSPAELIKEAQEIDSTVADSAAFGILTLTEEEVESLEEFFEGVDPSFVLEAIPNTIVASATSQTYTFNADTDVFWKISGVKLSETSTSTADSEEDNLDITIEAVTSTEDEAAPSDYGQAAIITVSSIAGYTPKGNYDITVQKSSDGDEWTDAGVLTFVAQNGEGGASDGSNIPSSGSGCDSGVSALGLVILLAALAIRRKAL